MRTYLAPPSFTRLPETKTATFLLAAGLVLAGCSSPETEAEPAAQESAAASRSGSAASSPSSEAPRTIPDCQLGVETDDGYCAVVQFRTKAFWNYEDASGPSDTVLDIGDQVMVRCRIEEQTIGSGEGGWYKISDSEEESIANHFSPANNFENGDVVGQPVNVAFDPDIRPCRPDEIPS